MAGLRGREEGDADGLADAVKPDCVFQLSAEGIAGLLGFGASAGREICWNAVRSRSARSASTAAGCEYRDTATTAIARGLILP